MLFYPEVPWSFLIFRMKVRRAGPVYLNGKSVHFPWKLGKRNGFCGEEESHT